MTLQEQVARAIALARHETDANWLNYRTAADAAISIVLETAASVADDYAARAWTAIPLTQDAIVAAEQIATAIRTR